MSAWTPKAASYRIALPFQARKRFPGGPGGGGYAWSFRASANVAAVGIVSLEFVVAFAWNSLARRLGSVVLAVSLGGVTVAQSAPLVLERDGRVISLEPYAANILRVTMSTVKAEATGAPGYGFVAKPSAEGWTHERDAEGGEVFRSSRMVVRVTPGNLPAEKLPQPMPLDALNRQLRDPYFGGGGGQGPFNDALLVTTADGKMLVHMRNWSMAPERADVAQQDIGAKGYSVAATFDSPSDEHYYGLGQQQKGWMDLRDHEIRCWHDYGAIGGEDVCVPFMVSSRGYGLVWDNPSKTTVDAGLQSTEHVVLGGGGSCFLLRDCWGYERRNLRGLSPSDRRNAHAAEGGVRIHPEQGDLSNAGTDSGCGEEVSREELPLDGIVVDFLNMTKQGELDLDPTRWPDPAGMNRELHAMGVNTLLSVWPHFSRGTQFYDMLQKNGWLIHKPDGTPDSGWTQGDDRAESRYDES